jgi:hypothetical protein
MSTNIIHDSRDKKKSSHLVSFAKELVVIDWQPSKAVFTNLVFLFGLLEQHAY